MAQGHDNAPGRPAAPMEGAARSQSAARARVMIAIPTFQREELLQPLLCAIQEDAADVDAERRILIVDNDPEESARAVAATLDAGYLAEPTPGIAAARQAALDSAAPNELVVMIDDDLLPEPGWLAGLVDAWQTYRPAAVMGFVRYVWREGTDPWIAAGGFMRRTRFPTGTELSALATGNVLIDSAQTRALGVRFDVGLGLSGGSDLEFGRVLLKAGGRIVASAESVARDDIVSRRTTLAFVRRRAICQGQVRARLMSRDELAAARIAKRAGHLVGGLLRVPSFVAGEWLARLRHDLPAGAVYRRRRWFAQGRVLGALGVMTPEYKRPA
ncbi:glycosyltransferase family 2 protein [Agrococcus sp. Ld7]|uniref:glycosyltransferase family 2 protein n=1 Tax=Agrococcus sp. Ld7 TaxID=649148 RepID=UPI0038694E22